MISYFFGIHQKSLRLVSILKSVFFIHARSILPKNADKTIQIIISAMVESPNNIMIVANKYTFQNPLEKFSNSFSVPLKENIAIVKFTIFFINR